MEDRPADRANPVSRAAPVSSDRRRALLVFLSTLVPIAFLTRGVVYLAGNDASRFAHIDALVEDGTSSIEKSPFAFTIDRVERYGRLYSNKPPVLAFAGAALYAPMHALGVSLRRPETRPLAARLLTILLCGVPVAWLAAELDAALLLFPGISRRMRALVTFAAVFGTTLLPFAVTLNGHAPAAALLFASFARALVGRPLAAGAFAGLAVCMDPAAALGSIPALLFVAYARRGARTALPFAAGLAAAALLFVAADFATTGSPLPPKSAPRAWDWTVAAGEPARLTQIIPGNELYFGEGLFGWQGFFTLSPVLLVGAAGVLLALRRSRPLSRAVTFAVLASVAAQVVAHCAFPALAGGWSYGFRYLVPVVPFLMFFTPAALAGKGRLVFAALLPASVALSLLGTYNPWPPVREKVRQQNPVIERVPSPAGANLAALVEQLAPGSELARKTGEAFLDADPAIRLRYLSYFYACRGDEERSRRYARAAEIAGG